MVLHNDRTHRTGAAVPDRSKHHDSLVLSQLSQYVHDNRLPELLGVLHFLQLIREHQACSSFCCCAHVGPHTPIRACCLSP